MDRIPFANIPSKYPENAIIEKNQKMLMYSSGYYGPSEGDFMVLLPGVPVPGCSYD